MVAYKAHNLSGGVQVPLPQQYSIRSECREVLISKLVGMTNIRKIRHVGGTELWEVANSP